MQLGLSLALTRGGGGFANAETAALIARFSGTPSSTRQALIDSTISAAKAAGVWALCDAFYMIAAHDAQAACQNWKADAYNLTATNAPTFTTDRGYTGDAAAAYLDTGYNPVTAGGQYVQDSAHLSVWNRTIRSGDGTVAIGNRNAGSSVYAEIVCQFSNLIIPRINLTSTTTLANPNSNGHFVATRTASNNVDAYRNGASLGSVASTSTTLNSVAFAILAASRVGTTPTGHTSDQIAAASIGSKLTAQQSADLYNLVLLPYMTAVGA